jgi:hypothetical protein
MRQARRYFTGLVVIITGLAVAGGLAAEAGKKTTQKEDKMANNSCVATAKGPLAALPKAETAGPAAAAAAAPARLARVGHPAPDFEANALIGKGFKNLKLSDYKGKWVVLCFYPGDFTFV